MAATASDLIQDVNGLISLPDVYLRISQVLNDPDSTSADIAKVVASDPSFTIRLLKVANSPIYRFSSAISTVDRAVTLIGTSQIASMALSLSVAKSFSGLPNGLVTMSNFWRHSLFCALIARYLAKSIGRCDPSTAFTAGLLHDIGELIIFNREPELAKEALLLVLDSDEELPVHMAEQQLLHFDHADVGAALARQWNLPPVLEESIGFHHNVAAAKKHPREAALIHICNVLAQMAELDTLEAENVPPIDPLAWEITGLTLESAEPAVRLAQGEIAEVEQMFIGAKA